MALKIITTIILCSLGALSAQAQLEKEDSIRLKNMLDGKEEIKINEDALRSIQFNFLPKEEAYSSQPLASEEKSWMKFITKLPDEFIRKTVESDFQIKLDLDFSLPNQTTAPLVTFDADKLLFENLTKRGRAIKHNRKYAQAWKIYNDYQPTYEDSLKWWGNEKRIPKDTLAIVKKDSASHHFMKTK